MVLYGIPYYFLCCIVCVPWHCLYGMVLRGMKWTSLQSRKHHSCLSLSAQCRWWGCLSQESIHAPSSPSMGKNCVKISSPSFPTKLPTSQFIQFDTNLASINIGAGQLDAGRCRKSPAPTLTASQARQLKETLKGEIVFHHDQLPPLLSGCCERCPRRVDWSRQQRRNESSQFHQQRLGEDKYDGNDENGFVDDQWLTSWASWFMSKTRGRQPTQPNSVCVTTMIKGSI